MVAHKFLFRLGSDKLTLVRLPFQSQHADPPGSGARCADGSKRIISKRYSEFEQLVSRLQSAVDGSALSIPKMQVPLPIVYVAIID